MNVHTVQPQTKGNATLPINETDRPDPTPRPHHRQDSHPNPLPNKQTRNPNPTSQVPLPLALKQLTCTHTYMYAIGPAGPGFPQLHAETHALPPAAMYLFVPAGPESETTRWAYAVRHIYLHTCKRLRPNADLNLAVSYLQMPWTVGSKVEAFHVAFRELPLHTGKMHVRGSTRQRHSSRSVAETCSGPGSRSSRRLVIRDW